MSAPLLAEFFLELPEEAIRDVPGLPTRRQYEDSDEPARRPASGGMAKRRAAVHIFCKRVRERYTEGTLVRLLQGDGVLGRRAAAFSLGLLGSPAVNESLALALHDEDEEVARLATDALWTLWFRGDNRAHSDDLHRLVRQNDMERLLQGLNDLIGRAPRFAEAYNQRAIAYFRLGQFDRSAADCETVLKLNAQHFGAQAGLGQCCLRLRRYRAALRAFRIALRINPRLESVAEAVRTLENRLGEEGR
jgi:tetratricopeptide (TPR) repeat protein